LWDKFDDGHHNITKKFCNEIELIYTIKNWVGKKCYDVSALSKAKLNRSECDSAASKLLKKPHLCINTQQKKRWLIRLIIR